MVDASVVVKCIIVEPQSDLARTLIESAQRLRQRLVAPDVMLLEVAGVIRRHGRRGDMSPEEVDWVTEQLASLPVRVVPVRHLWRLAVQCALCTGASVYDAAYVVLAAGIGTPLITADAALVRAVVGTPFADVAVLLEEWIGCA